MCSAGSVTFHLSRQLTTFLGVFSSNLLSRRGELYDIWKQCSLFSLRRPSAGCKRAGYLPLSILRSVSLRFLLYADNVHDKAVPLNHRHVGFFSLTLGVNWNVRAAVSPRDYRWGRGGSAQWDGTCLSLPPPWMRPFRSRKAIAVAWFPHCAFCQPRQRRACE